MSRRGSLPGTVPLLVALALGAGACAAAHPPADDGVRVPGGRFVPGALSGYLEERGGQPVTVAAFRLDRHEVTHAQFAAFVRATGHVTEAERAGGSVVFQALSEDEARRGDPWWTWTAGANWRRPQGPLGPAARADHPVVHVTRADAQAYARWMGHRLPTEAEWEWAARGAVAKPDEDLEAAQGNTPAFQRQLAGRANTWQGPFPVRDAARDGWRGTAPVGGFRPNRLGLFDMVGNVWELTADRWTPTHANPLDSPDTLRPVAEVPPEDRVVIKGGSYLCAPNYCVRYRPASRQPHDAHLSTGHLGFRTVWDDTPRP